jgi:hypothetical protein
MMDGQKTRKTEVARKAPIRVQSGLWDNVRVLDSKLGEIDELAVDEDFDLGGDPYRTTVSRRKTATTEAVVIRARSIIRPFRARSY